MHSLVSSKNNSELLQISSEDENSREPIWKWSVEEKYENALSYKEKGIQFFNSERYVDAFQMFSKACKILITLEPISSSDTQMKDICELRLKLYNNMAECHLRRKNYEHVITLCSKVLLKSPNNVKALYRRGIAYGNLKDFEKAVNDLKIVIALEPRNLKAQEHYKDFSDKLRKSIEGYESIVRKMFKV